MNKGLSMKDQKHNEGELGDLAVKVEKKMLNDLKTMSKNSGLSEDEIVIIALKRFKSSHADYMGIDLDYP